MLADLVERSRQERQLDAATERRVWESAFRALAVVVVHYRIIALVDADGALDVLAIDPTENRATANAVLADVVTAGDDHGREAGPRPSASPPASAPDPS